MKYFVVVFFAMSINFVNAQDASSEIEKQYDFWLGSWDVSWDEGNGQIGQGTNHIKKILDGKVIQENFTVLSGASKGFEGTSVSIYHTQSKQWKQTWVDNQGGHFNFIGESDGTKRIFKTKKVIKNDQEVILRMVFYNISKDAFTWDWESSNNGGKTWMLKWRINYKRTNQ